MAELYHKMPYQSEMSQVSMDGYRGFGGACFPKDVAAFDQYYADKLTEFMLEYNFNLQNNK
jgi:UDP-glucose 6-dehydrogenase